MQRYTLPLTAACALLLSACGGGGGGDNSSAVAGAPVATVTPAAPVVTVTPAAPVTPVTPVTPAAPVATTTTSTQTSITADKAASAAHNAYAGATLASQSSTSVTSLVAGVTMAPASVSAVDPVLALVKRAYAQGAPKLVAGITVSEACSGGGTVTLDANVRNEDVISNGDTIAATASNCVEGGVLVNGAFTVVASGVSGDIANAGVGAATLATRFTNFSVGMGTDSGAVSVTGDMTIGVTANGASNLSLAISGSTLQGIEQRPGGAAATRTMTNYSVTGAVQGSTTSAAASFTISGTSAALGQFSYTVKNLKPFVTTGGATPVSGALIVNGAASSVTLTVLDAATVKLEYSAKGDGVITDSRTLAWRDFLAAN